MIINFWKKNEPDFINELGVKWWLDVVTTEYAEKENINGTTLEVKVYLIQKPNGYKTRVIVDRRGIVYDHQSLENILYHIDTMKLMKEKC